MSPSCPHARRRARLAPLLALAALSVCAGGVFAQACPDYRKNGRQLAYSANELHQAKWHTVVAGGAINLGQCNLAPGAGHVGDAPDFTITYAGDGRALEFRVQSQCDATLLVNDPAADWHYDDDGNGNLDPKLRISSARSGIYDVWIGTIAENTCQAQLIVETF